MGYVIAALRTRVGLTQRELAARMGVTTATVSRWEQGHNDPPKRIHVKLARVLGVSPEDLRGQDAVATPGKGESDGRYPDWADDGARRALVDFFAPDLNLAIEVDLVMRDANADSWVGNATREKKVKGAIRAALPADYGRIDELLELVKARQEYR